MKILQKTVDMILPPRCIVTGEIVDDPGMLAPEAWGRLNFIADPRCNICGVPFDFGMDGDGAACAACLTEPPSFQKARSALLYDDYSRDIILGFKHGDQTHMVRSFVPWLKMAGSGFLGQTDYLIPVPLHPWRLFRRRFNQAALMAQFLGKNQDIPCLSDGLIRLRSTASQGHLKPKERRKNVRGAFQVAPHHTKRLHGKIVTLIDDVYTTGATIDECTQALLTAGVKAVYVLTLARVVKPTKPG